MKVLLGRFKCDFLNLKNTARSEKHIVDTGSVVLVLRMAIVRRRIRTNTYTARFISNIVGTRTSLILPALECICEGELTICPLLSLLLIEIVSIDSIARGGGV